MSQCSVSRIIKQVLTELKMKLEEYERIEKLKPKVKKSRSDTKKTIYEFFSNYSKEQVDDIIKTLKEEEKELIALKFKNNYKIENPIVMDMVDANKFYNLIYKMKNKLKKI